MAVATSDSMVPIDPLWAYVGIPSVLVSILVLIKLLQGRTEERAMSAFASKRKEAERSSREAAVKSSVEVKDNHAKLESSKETKPPDCQQYLGYLYMRKASDRTNIPSECYNCPKLLQCLYSPNIVEKIYG